MKSELILMREDLQQIYRALERVANDYGHRLQRIRDEAKEAEALAERIHKHLT